MKKKVLLFGDIGIDDTIALIYARLHKEIEIVGLIADYGNVSRKDAVANIYYVMKLFDFPEGIPVILGAEIPLTGEQQRIIQKYMENMDLVRLSRTKIMT